MKGWRKNINPINPQFETLKVGNINAGNYFEIETAGNIKLNGDATQWDDLRFPLVGQRLDVAAGRIDYNYDDCTVDFQDNALYAGDPVCFIAQMSHSKELGSAIELHLHWFQNQNQTPNWLLAYRWVNMGESAIAVGSEILLKWTSNAITYTSGTISQLTEFGNITKPTTDTISSILQIRLFRDSNNASTLFAGADPYTGDAQAIEFDIHYIKDGFGSNQEYVK